MLLQIRSRWKPGSSPSGEPLESGLLFVSLDAADDWRGRDPSQRTLEAMREAEERFCYPEDPKVVPKGRHWYEIHELAHDTLGPVAIARSDDPILFAIGTSPIRTAENARIPTEAAGRVAGLYPRAVAAGDFNGDGKLDLAVVYQAKK